MLTFFLNFLWIIHSKIFFLRLATVVESLNKHHLIQFKKVISIHNIYSFFPPAISNFWTHYLAHADNYQFMSSSTFWKGYFREELIMCFYHKVVLNVLLLVPVEDCTVYAKVQLSIKVCHSYSWEPSNSTPKAYAPGYSTDSQNKVFGLISPPSHGNILDIKILGTHPKSTKSEIQCVLTSPLVILISNKWVKYSINTIKYFVIKKMNENIPGTFIRLIKLEQRSDQ